MAHNRKMSVPSAGRLFERLRMGEKKTIMAGVLISVMLLMWVRVFIGHRPAAAAAETAAPPKSAETLRRPAPVKVKLVELPKSPGRQDAIERDFFTVKDRANFRPNAGRNPGTDTEVPMTSSNFAQEGIQRVAQTLKLEAVLWNESPRAFINDQLLSVGGKLVVKDSTQVFEFEVLQIYVDSVLVRCEGIQLTLELAQILEVVN